MSSTLKRVNSIDEEDLEENEKHLNQILNKFKTLNGKEKAFFEVSRHNTILIEH